MQAEMNTESAAKPKGTFGELPQLFPARLEWVVTKVACP
jgi:hypothetical protein